MESENRFRLELALIIISDQEDLLNTGTHWQEKGITVYPTSYWREI